MTVQQTEPPADNNPQDGDGTAPGELPEKEGGFSALKLVAIVFIIIVIIIALSSNRIPYLPSLLTYQRGRPSVTIPPIIFPMVTGRRFPTRKEPTFKAAS